MEHKRNWTMKMDTEHVKCSVTEDGQEIKFTEMHSFVNNEPFEQNFMVNGSLFHVEGIKRLKLKATKEDFDISTEAGKVSIKCPTPHAYFITKDGKGKVAARVMTQEEIDTHSMKVLNTN